MTLWNTILLQAPSGGAPSYMNIIFIVGLIVIFYFFMIRPQQSKQKKQKQFSEALKKGDTVVTIGGIHGKIIAMEGNTLQLEVDKGVKIKVDRASISLENTEFAQKPATDSK
ncbi:preprotein translocase subunit YajC [Rapidithrix thailandica]|uniref:Sec translocon accessory complex subunit YajC n=1 Tax=Rapidithrix thailandica TaxID=413964 RepID=A0AAW9S9Z0_9BACT